MKVANDDRFPLLCACMAASNMGHEIDLSKLAGRGYDHLNDAVEFICGRYIESDRDFCTFLNEAKSWADNLRHLTIDEAKEQYPTAKSVLEAI